MTNLGSGLACKISGFTATPAAVGFVLSKAELQKLEDLRKTMADTSKAVQGGSRYVAAGLGAVALGLAFNAMTKASRR